MMTTWQNTTILNIKTPYQILQKNKLGTETHFVQQLGSNWEKEIDDLFNKIKWTQEQHGNENSIPKDRAALIMHLAAILSFHCPDTKPTDFVFIASQAISNMEEIYGGQPFGIVHPSNVPLGKGALAALRVLSQNTFSSSGKKSHVKK